MSGSRLFLSKPTDQIRLLPCSVRILPGPCFHFTRATHFGVTLCFDHHGSSEGGEAKRKPGALRGFEARRPALGPPPAPLLRLGGLLGGGARLRVRQALAAGRSEKSALYACDGRGGGGGRGRVGVSLVFGFPLFFELAPPVVCFFPGKKGTPYIFGGVRVMFVWGHAGGHQDWGFISNHWMRRFIAGTTETKGKPPFCCGHVLFGSLVSKYR